MIATLAQVRREIDVQLTATGTASETVSDTFVLQALRIVSTAIERVKDYPFMPVIRTRYYDCTDNNIDRQNQLLYLAFPLVSASEVINGQNVTLSDTTDYYYYQLGNGITPYGALGMYVSSPYRWQIFNTQRLRAIRVTGIWCYHEDYANAWVNSADSVQNAGGINATATSITVTSVSGADSQNDSPRFSAGNLIRIDTEFMEVVATNSTTNVLTVIRGVNGSTAASHTASTAIYTFAPEPPIVQAAVRWAAMLYKRRGSFERTTFDGVATINYPKDMPDDVVMLLANYPSYNVFGVP